jgi:FkbM family methyltransferase
MAGPGTGMSAGQRALLLGGVIVLAILALRACSQSSHAIGPAYRYVSAVTSQTVESGPPRARGAASSAFARRADNVAPTPPAVNAPTIAPTARNAAFLSFVEERPGEEDVVAIKARLATLGVLRFEPTSVGAPPGSHTCPVLLPPRVAIVESRSASSVGGVTWVAKSGSGPAGSEHFEMYDSILRASSAKPCAAIDCGANEGAITTWLASRGCRVFAYEALRSNYRRVFSSLQASGFKDKVSLYNAAVSDSCMTAFPISENTGNDENGHRNGQINVGTFLPENSVVYSRRVDDDVDQDILLFKIDVEGFEPPGIAGAVRLLRTRNVVWVHAEFSPSNVADVISASGANVGASGWLYMMAALDFEIYLADCQQSKGYGPPAKTLCGPPEGRALIDDILNQGAGAVAKRIYFDEIELHVRVLKGKLGQVNLLLFNRRAFAAYGLA